jgi:hypothetical protein
MIASVPLRPRSIGAMVHHDPQNATLSLRSS